MQHVITGSPENEYCTLYLVPVSCCRLSCCYLRSKEINVPPSFSYLEKNKKDTFFLMEFCNNFEETVPIHELNMLFMWVN